MAKKLGIRLKTTMHEDWGDLELGTFVYVRTATLMNQIIASTLFEESSYKVERIRELLNRIGGPDFNSKQRELFSILERILSPIENEDLPTVNTMVENATRQLQPIHRFCWRGHSELIKGLQEVIFSDRCKEKGWDPEVVMNALVIALVREIISLFGLNLDNLINSASDAFDGDTIDALRRIVTLHSSVMSPEACFKARERNEYVDKYQVVVKAFDFKLHFIFQPKEQRENYVDMVPTDEAPWEIWHTLSKLVKDLQQTLRNERSNHHIEQDEFINDKERLDQEITANKRTIQTLRRENHDSQEQIQKVEDLNRNLEEQLGDLRAKMEGRNCFNADHAEMLHKINHLTSEEKKWRKKYEGLKLELFKEVACAYTAKAKTINKTIHERSGIAECDFVELYLTLTADLIENLGDAKGEQADDNN